MLIIYNARIYTQNPFHEFGTALAIDHGWIVAVGTDEEILSTYSSGNKLNASGRTLIPGLTDSHIHLQNYAFSLQKLDCETKSKAECIQKVAQRANQSLPGEWILGHGWNQNTWTDGYGTAGLLDEVSPRNPVYLTHKSLHCGWANTAALQQAGIGRTTPDPPNGRIGRLPGGDPDGILYESASELVENVIPEPGLESVVNAIRSTQPILWKMGLTGVHDFDQSLCFSALQVLHQAGELKLRVVKSIPLEKLTQAIDLGLRSGFGDDTLRIGSVKLFSDGALGPHTAAMLQPYEDDPDNAGILMLDAEELFEIGQKAVQHGISMAVHAIGDRANHEVLNAYTQIRGFEHSIQPEAKKLLRHRLEHVQIQHSEDVQRLAALNIIPSMQPIHATSDMIMADKFWGKRSEFAYAWRSQLGYGAHLIFGSDAPVESPNPFWGIHAAVTRRRMDGSPSSQGWYPEQRITVSEAVKAYSSTPAYAAGMEDRFGRISPGYAADLIIVNEDPYTCPPDLLPHIRPLATMVGGEWVFSKLE